MDKKMLELEKSLFKLEFMNDKKYLNQIIDDNYIEVGKSGVIFSKKDVINELLSLNEDRNIDIYNYSCAQLSKDIFIVHYITISDNNKIYRTSIWKKEIDYKIIFHQASLLKSNEELIKY